MANLDKIKQQSVDEGVNIISFLLAREQQIDDIQQATLNKALNSSESEQPHEDYQANEASSSVHNAGKSGWCYIGMDRGFRTCGEVGVNDTCMSGDIFPSQEICMNPRLRA